MWVHYHALPQVTAEFVVSPMPGSPMLMGRRRTSGANDNRITVSTTQIEHASAWNGINSGKRVNYAGLVVVEGDQDDNDGDGEWDEFGGNVGFDRRGDHSQ